MTLTTLTCGVALAASVSLGAQSNGAANTTTVEIKDGKHVKVTGCVEAGPAEGYVLTDVADKKRTMHRYILMARTDEVAKMLGHRVQIEGKVGDRSHGRIEITTETKGEKDEKVEDSGPYLEVTHITMLAASCR